MREAVSDPGNSSNPARSCLFRAESLPHLGLHCGGRVECEEESQQHLHDRIAGMPMTCTEIRSFVDMQKMGVIGVLCRPHTAAAPTGGVRSCWRMACAMRALPRQDFASAPLPSSQLQCLVPYKANSVQAAHNSFRAADRMYARISVPSPIPLKHFSGVSRADIGNGMVIPSILGRYLCSRPAGRRRGCSADPARRRGASLCG